MYNRLPYILMSDSGVVSRQNSGSADQSMSLSLCQTHQSTAKHYGFDRGHI